MPKNLEIIDFKQLSGIGIKKLETPEKCQKVRI